MTEKGSKKINKIDKPLARLIHFFLKHKLSISRMTIEPTNSKRITKNYYEYFMSINFNNLDQIEKFLKWHKLPKLIQEKIKNRNSSISVKEMEPVIQTFSLRKPHSQVILLGEAICHGPWAPLNFLAEYAILQCLTNPSNGQLLWPVTQTVK